MERIAPLPLLLFLPAFSFAQLINGSFEGNGTGDLSGWTGLCWDPYLAASNCPDGGDWGLVVESGHTNGCINAIVIQKLPEVQDGTLLRLSGWCTRYFGNGGQFIGFGLGAVNNGSYTYNTYPQSNFSGWQYFDYEQVIELGAGDTAMVFLQPGFVNAPFITSFVMFDELELSDISTGVDAVDRSIPHRYDAAARRIHLAPTLAPAEVTVFDAQGRRLHAPVEQRATGELVVDAAALPPGLLVVQVNDAQDAQWARIMAY